MESGDGGRLTRRRIVFHEEINRLPRALRAAIVLCDLQGRSPGSIARELRVPASAMTRRLASARALLHTRMVLRGHRLSSPLSIADLSREMRRAVPARLIDSTVAAASRCRGDEDGEEEGLVNEEGSAVPESINLQAPAATIFQGPPGALRP